MATTRKTIEEINKELTEKGQSALDERNKVVTDTAQKNIDLINKGYDAAEQKVTDNYNLGVDDINQNAADQRRVQQAQRIANERNITERMANLGLTDSGLNRSQQTGIQLSYANNVSKINQNQQRAIDTLAAAMRASMSDLSLERASKVADVETDRDNAIAQNNLDFKNSVSQQATDIYNAETEAIAKQNTAKANLYGILGDQSKSSSEMNAAINSYALNYGLSDEEMAELKKLANQTLTNAAASAFAKETEKEVSSLESFIFSSSNNDKAKFAKINSAYNKGYISSQQKTYYDSLVSAVSTEGEEDESQKNDDKDNLYDEFEKIDDKVASGDLDEETAKTRKERRFKQYVSKHGVDADFDFYKDLGYEHLYYEGWTFNDWYDYFKGYKQSNGKEKAMREYARINGLGYIPAEYAADVFTATQR